MNLQKKVFLLQVSLNLSQFFLQIAPENLKLLRLGEVSQFLVFLSHLQGVHKVLHTFKILISQKPHMVETLDFRQ